MSARVGAGPRSRVGARRRRPDLPAAVPAHHDRRRVKRFRGSVLVSAALSAALTPLNSTMVAVALPALATQFSSPAATVTVFVVTGYLFTTLVLSVPAGSVADRVGYARALLWGRWLFVGGSIIG